MEGVVPLAMELVAGDRQCSNLGLGDLDPFGVAAGVPLGMDGQARRGRGRADQLDYDLVAGQRPPAPVHRDVAEQPVLNPVPLRRPGRVMADRDLKPRLGGQAGELDLPEPQPVAVAAARVGADQHPRRVRVGDLPDLRTPAAQGLGGERRGVVVLPDHHEPRVRADVVDAVRDRLPEVFCGEVVDTDPLRVAGALPLTTTVLIRGFVADQLLLLGIDAHYNLPRREVLAGLPVDVAKLRIAIGMLLTLDRLGVGLQMEPQPVQQLPDPHMTGRMPRLGQRPGQLPGALARPPQWRLRIPSTLTIHQRLNRPQQLRIALRRPLAPRPLRTHPILTNDRRTRLELTHPTTHRVPRHPRRRSHHAHTPAPQRARPRTRQQPPLTLIPHRCHIPQQPADRTLRADHATAFTTPATIPAKWSTYFLPSANRPHSSYAT